MSDPFESGAYSLEQTNTMKSAFDIAWTQVKLIDQDVAITRRLLASTIIDLVDDGICDSDEIVASALATMAVAQDLS